MIAHRLVPLAFAFVATTAFAQDSYKLESLKTPPPDALAPAIRDELQSQGYRLLDGQGNVYAEIWLRKVIPASGKPEGPKGTILFPVLSEGEVLGALRFPAEGHDYRDQSIPKGVYTLRYGLQPVNGDHLGVSPYRDYALLLPAGKDKELKDLPRKALEERSAEAAGTTHPAILMLFTAPESSVKGEVAPIHDDAKNTWGVPLPLKLGVKGEPQSPALPVQLVVIGVAAT
ncbi:MAG: hypothetical protein P4L84_28415 [Isosphaeraceae bacterium]|nr:hypothetical protein [Isosphaeraceae bacterium]